MLHVLDTVTCKKDHLNVVNVKYDGPNSKREEERVLCTVSILSLLRKIEENPLWIVSFHTIGVALI